MTTEHVTIFANIGLQGRDWPYVITLMSPSSDPGLRSGTRSGVKTTFLAYCRSWEEAMAQLPGVTHRTTGAQVIYTEGA